MSSGISPMSAIFLLHVGSFHDALHLAVQLGDDVRRRAGRRQQHVPRHRLEIGRADGFAERRQLGHGRQPRRRRDRERAQLAVADERQRRAGLGEGHRDMAGRHVGDRLRAVAIGHMREIDVEALLHVFGGQMRRAADAGRRIAELARPLLDVFDQFRNGVDRQRRIDHQDERRLHIERDRDEVLQRIVGHDS